MKKERCKIFCIYFKRNSSNSSRLKKATDLLKEIAKIGDTDDLFIPNSLESLCETFNKISDAIQTNYKLELTQ